METKFATITDTFIGVIDGAMKFRIQFFTDDYVSYLEIELSPIGVACMAKILEVVGVKQWEHLRAYRLKIKDEGFGSEITSICNMSGADWFDIQEFLEGEKKTQATNENTCVCCGYPIPEGRHVCNTCALNGVD